MNFDKNKTITYAGASLLAHSDSVKKATVIDSIIISSNIPSSSADIMKLSFDDFGNYKEFPVVNIRQNDNVFQPEALISNEGFAKDFDLTMVGLKGHTDGEEDNQIIALAIDNSNNPFTIPKQSNVPYKLYLDLPIGYSNSNNVIMNVNNAGMVTMEDVNDAITIAVKNLETIDNHDKDISSLSKYIQAVEMDKNSKLSYTTFNDFKSKENFQFHGPWNGNITDLKAQPDGIWQIANNTQGAPNGFGGYGFAIKYHNDSDYIIDLYDNNTGRWTHTDYSGWYQLATTDLFNKAYQFRSIWKNSILALKNQEDGYYSLLNNFSDAPNGFSGYGLALVKHDAVNDTYIVLNDNANGEWHNHFGNGAWSGWQRVATQADVDNTAKSFATINNVNKDIMRRISTGFLHNWRLNTFYMNNPYPSAIPLYWFDENNNTINFQGSIAVNNGDWICFENTNILDYMNANGYTNFNLDSQFMNYQNVGQQQVFIRPNVKCGVIQFQANYSGKVNLDGCWLKVKFS